MTRQVIDATMVIRNHILEEAQQVPSPNCDDRDDGFQISLIVIHSISLPRGHYGGDFVCHLFCNRLDHRAHTDFESLDGLRVSSHLLIRRNGEIVQFVPFDRRAWHAGESSYRGRPRCNDFSIGIELEGTDDSSFTVRQYREAAAVCRQLCAYYNLDPEHIAGHSDIAPARKTDPGSGFEWERFRKLIADG